MKCLKQMVLVKNKQNTKEKKKDFSRGKLKEDTVFKERENKEIQGKRE